VNGTVITAGDLDQATAEMLVQYARQMSPEQAAQLRPMVRKQALENLVGQELLLQEAKRQQITVDPQRLESEAAKIRRPVRDSRSLLGRPSPARGSPSNSFRSDLSDGLMVQTMLQTKLAGQDTGER